MQNTDRKPIASFRDLEVYQVSYRASIIICHKILNNLPKYEWNDLVSQLRRSSKAIPRLIAEGYAKRHQKKGFQKYLDDAMAECNETEVSLEHCRDIYGLLCDDLLASYNRLGKQIYRLSQVWTNFKKDAGQG
jgi:four helix bundle protein